MVIVVFVAIFVWGCVSLSAGEMPLNMEACDIGDVVQNECSKCTCTVRHVYECKQKPCKKYLRVEDFKLVNKKNMSCQPHKIYHQLSTICICRGDGTWPHESCYTTFRTLPAAKIIKKKCTGNKYAIIDCNICMCNNKGEIESERCTQNDCDDDVSQTDHRRKTKTTHVFGNCLAQNWYSLAPCQFCYCLNNNKLVCNTGNINTHGIQLGSYNFSLCGPDYLKEALEFVGAADTKGNDSVLRMGSVLDIKSAAKAPKLKSQKPRKHKSEDIRELFDKADVERSQKKKTEKKKGHEDIPFLTEQKKSHKKPIGRERKQEKKETREESDSDGKDDKDGNHYDKGDRDEDGNDEEEENKKTESVEESKEKSHKKNKVADSTENEANEDEDADGDEDDDDVAFDLGAVFKKNLPKLKKLFNIRRTVVLDSLTKCEPGTQKVIECNTCFCMKNGKMLCTDKKCN